jgi:hypothetical protein
VKRIRWCLLALAVMLSGCSFIGEPRNTAPAEARSIELVIGQIKSDLGTIDLTPLKGTTLACEPKVPATLKVSIDSVSLSLQNTTVIDVKVDASGKNIPVFGIPLSPGLSDEAKSTDGTQIDIVFGHVDLPSGSSPEATTTSPAAKPVSEKDLSLGELVKGAEFGVLNATHIPPCLPVAKQLLTITRTFEVVKTDTATTEFGFKVFYSAGYTASHASDVKNTITIKLLMSGTEAIYP